MDLVAAGIVSKHLYKGVRTSGNSSPGGLPGGWFRCDIGAIFPPIKIDRPKGRGGLVAGGIFGGPNATVKMF
jgi:hypothetical protein